MLCAIQLWNSVPDSVIHVMDATAVQSKIRNIKIMYAGSEV